MARLKKSRSMRGKLGVKTGSKEMMKEQKKARKSKEISRFQVKKAKQRKDQAHKKLSRLGLLPEDVIVAPEPRPRRFTMPVKEAPVQKAKAPVASDNDSLSTQELLDAFAEAE